MLGVEVREVRAGKLKIGDTVYTVTTQGKTRLINSEILDIIPNTGKTTFDGWVTDELLRVVFENGFRMDIHREDFVRAWLDNADRR